MDVLMDVYHKGLLENEKQIRFWEDYLKKLKDLDLSFYTKRLKMPILVPIGNRILFRGELIHTNEVTVALGANYFAKCSTIQAEILRQHRITDATNKIALLKEEKKYLESHLSFSNENVFNDNGHEIIEPFVVEDEDLWRAKHKENVRKYMQQRNKDIKDDTISDQELWARLEELELQEELEQLNIPSINEETGTNKIDVVESRINLENDIGELELNDGDENVDELTFGTKEQITLKEILNRQKSLKNQLLEMKHKERSKVQNEEELIAHLDEVEELELIEDEIDRIDAEIQSTDKKTEEIQTVDDNKSRKSISFADDEVETIEINFKHSDVLPSLEPYDSKNRIKKPSDIYSAFHHLFTLRGTPSILRKTAYVDKEGATECKTLPVPLQDHNINSVSNSKVMIKEIIEKIGGDVKPNDSSTRPQSLFKMRKSQKKKLGVS